MTKQESTVGNVVMGLMATVIVAGAIYLAYMHGGGLAQQSAAPDKQTQTIKDRGSDAPARQPATFDLPTPVPPANNATAETRSQVQYGALVATPVPEDAVPAWAAELPSCSSGRTPCVFDYSSGPRDSVSAPNLATGGTNTGSDGNPQKDTDQAATFNGDKP